MYNQMVLIEKLFSQLSGSFSFSRSLIFFIAFILIFSCKKVEKQKTEIVLKTESVEIKHTDDIVSLTDSLVKPILYSHISGLDFLPIAEKKDKFISALLPAILVVKRELRLQQERLNSLNSKAIWQPSDSSFFHSLADKFKTHKISELSAALQTHPNSIVLAQAAVESGWGNSRIFSEGNNLFGIWSYNRNEPRIPAKIKRGTKTVYLRKYNDISESIKNYFVTIGRSGAYRSFRNTRLNTDDVFELIPHLRMYSERREEYVAQLGTVIRFNQLQKYDNYQIHPESFVEVNVDK